MNDSQVRGPGADPDGLGDDQPPSDEGQRPSPVGAGPGEGVQPVHSETFPAFVHWCEVCGLELLLTPEIAFHAGWDFPPRMGEFGVISPRTCGNCGIEGTVWFAMAVGKMSVEDLSDEQYAKVLRIVAEKDR